MQNTEVVEQICAPSIILLLLIYFAREVLVTPTVNKKGCFRRLLTVVQLFQGIRAFPNRLLEIAASYSSEEIRHSRSPT